MSDTVTHEEPTVVLPAPGLVTMYVSEEPSEEMTPRLAAGWNSTGSPVIMDDDGSLRLLDDDEVVREIEW